MKATLSSSPSHAQEQPQAGLSQPLLLNEGRPEPRRPKAPDSELADRRQAPFPQAPQAPPLHPQPSPAPRPVPSPDQHADLTYGAPGAQSGQGGVKQAPPLVAGTEEGHG